MYKIFNTLSAFIRQFCLSNPYEMYFKLEVYAEIFNIFIGGAILHVFSLFLASSIYEKRKHQSWVGCILYCISYIFNTFLLKHLCYSFKMIEIQYIFILGFIINVIIYILIRKIKEKLLCSSLYRL